MQYDSSSWAVKIHKYACVLIFMFCCGGHRTELDDVMEMWNFYKNVGKLSQNVQNMQKKWLQMQVGSLRKNPCEYKIKLLNIYRFVTVAY
jgi:hypothetical protein